MLLLCASNSESVAMRHKKQHVNVLVICAAMRTYRSMARRKTELTIYLLFKSIETAIAPPWHTHWSISLWEFVKRELHTDDDYYAFIYRTTTTAREKKRKEENHTPASMDFFRLAPKRIFPLKWLFSSNLHSRCWCWWWCWYYRLHHDSYCYCCFKCDNIFHLLCTFTPSLLWL